MYIQVLAHCSFFFTGNPRHFLEFSTFRMSTSSGSLKTNQNHRGPEPTPKEDFTTLVMMKCSYHSQNEGVSKKRGTPKSSILIGFSIINHPFWGTPIFGNTHEASSCFTRFSHLDTSCLTFHAHRKTFLHDRSPLN